MTQNEIRRESAEKKVAAAEKRIARLTAKIAKTTDEYDIMWAKRDLESAEKDLTRATADLAKYTAAVDEDRRIRKSVQSVPAIKEFMDAWEVRAREYYADLRVRYDEEKAKEPEVSLKAIMKLERWPGNPQYKTEEAAQKRLDIALDPATSKYSNGHMDNLKHDLKHAEMDRFRRRNGEQNVNICFESPERVAEIVHKERVAKELDFVLRIQEVVGVITDAAGIHLGMNGIINGVVHGEKGSAKVNTIDAGGYNIQCYHFRVLVKKI